jgi:hypothetical protein
LHAFAVGACSRDRIEIDPAYCDVTIRRLRAVCGLEAVLEATGQRFAEVEAERLGGEVR